MSYIYNRHHRKDIRFFGPSTKNGCPGSFPQGFVDWVRREWWGKKRLWMCSGGFSDPEGVMVDIRPQTRPTIVGDATRLPLKADTFDFVLADPPYSKEEAQKLYGTENPSVLGLIVEGARVLKPGGHFLFLHRLVPGHDPRIPDNLELLAVVGVAVTAHWTNLRALTVFRKIHGLDFKLEVRQ